MSNFMEKFAKLSSKVAEYDSNAKIFASKHLLIAILQTHGNGRTTSSMFYVYLKVKEVTLKSKATIESLTFLTFRIR